MLSAEPLSIPAQAEAETVLARLVALAYLSDLERPSRVLDPSSSRKISEQRTGVTSSLRATKRDRKVSASEPLMKTLAWARVSTEKAERDGASIFPEQLREIRAFADKHGMDA